MTRVSGFIARSLSALLVCAVLATAMAERLAAQDNNSTARAFTSPMKAVSALIQAAKSKDATAVAAILGPDTMQWLSSGDPVQDAAARDKFVAAYDAKNKIIIEDGKTAELVVGQDGFPFPFPIVETDKGWVFDPEQGKEEILNRRIGENELNTVQVLQAIVDAQYEYAQEDRDGDGLHVYASKFASSPGKRDGLYWPTEAGEPASPLGPLVAQATREGYTARSVADDAGPAPYHGYKFRIVTRQGSSADGGAFDYIVGGKLLGGFAVLAYPAKYGVSGIMTFIVNHDGIIYEADLGPETERRVEAIVAYDPDQNWAKTQPEP